jgi:hypothetical protein
MRVSWTMLGGLVGAVVAAATAQAQSYPWCSHFHDGAGTNCGFTSYEQCMATSRGSGGYCDRNTQYTPPAVAASRSRSSSSRGAASSTHD